jgi:hypothetical protein
MITTNPALLTAEHLPAYILARTDSATMKAAHAVLQGLTRLSDALTTDDLLRHVIAHGEEPARVLAGLAESLDEALTAFLAERQAAGELLRTDRLERHALDIAAMELLGYAESDMRHHQRQAVAVRAAADQELDRLKNARLSAPEIEALLEVRKGQPDPQIAEHQQQAQVCAERVAVLEAFLGDRLRDTAALGDALLAELRERAKGIILRATQRDPVEVALRTKFVKNVEERDRLIARLTGRTADAQPTQG